MKKFLYIAAIMATVATATTSCNNEVEDLFDKSAAERTQEAVDEYSSVLTANGGKWVLEYFTNPDEPGYIYIFTFDNNGSVKISGKNLWIGNAFKSETSAWEVISDNGPVLTLNTYNTIFHLFANPENVVVPGASSDDIDETGYGHYGDYEFMLMEANDGVVRLKGKKWGVTHYLRQLDANTDDEAYLQKIDEVKASLFSSKFPELVITDGNTGERFFMTGATSSIVTIHPENILALDQHTTANFITTENGIRFMSEVEVEREDKTKDPLTFQTFTIAENGSLVCAEDPNIVITAHNYGFLLVSDDYSWSFTGEDCTGAIAEAYQTLADDFKKVFKNKRNLKSIEFSSALVSGERLGTIKLVLQSSSATYYCKREQKSDSSFEISLLGTGDKNGEAFKTQIASIEPFLNALVGEYNLTSEEVLAPKVIKATRADNESSTFTVTVK